MTPDRRSIAIAQLVDAILRIMPGASLTAAAAAIAARIPRIAPSDLFAIDRAVRARSTWYAEPWYALDPASVPHLAHVLVEAGCVEALGFVGSHPNGYVREAVVHALGEVRSGAELPFLALRANDWVPVIATAAADLILRRLTIENRAAVVSASPVLARMPHASV